jgi:hypothetical protein
VLLEIDPHFRSLQVVVEETEVEATLLSQETGNAQSHLVASTTLPPDLNASSVKRRNPTGLVVVEVIRNLVVEEEKEAQASLPGLEIGNAQRHLVGLTTLPPGKNVSSVK